GRNNYALQGKEMDDALLSEEERVRLEEVAFRDQEREQVYIAAQRHYLQGDWVATERTLHQLLKQDARDAQSRLMLATLWRHQGRLSEAARQLDKLERLETA